MKKNEVKIIDKEDLILAKNFLISILEGDLNFNRWKDRGVPFDFFITDSMDEKILVIAKTTGVEINENFYDMPETIQDEKSHWDKISAFFNDDMTNFIMNKWMVVVKEDVNEEILNFIKKYHSSEMIWRLEPEKFNYIENVFGDVVRKKEMTFSDFLEFVKKDNDKKLKNVFINNEFVVKLIVEDMINNLTETVVEEFEDKLKERMSIIGLPKNFEDLSCLVIDNTIDEQGKYGIARFILVDEKEEPVAIVYINIMRYEKMIKVEMFNEEKLKRLVEVYKYLLKADELLEDIMKKDDKLSCISLASSENFKDNPLKYLENIENIKYTEK